MEITIYNKNSCNYNHFTYLRKQPNTCDADTWKVDNTNRINGLHNVETFIGEIL